MKEKNVAIVGATGSVGIEMIKVLEKCNFPVNNLKLLASARSIGKSLDFKGEKIPVQEMKADSLIGTDIALFSAGKKISKQFATAAIDASAIMIDNSNAFRMELDVPLVVPEINPKDIEKHTGIIANPNCTTIIMGLVLWPIYKNLGLKRVVATTYQSASGAGALAMEELKYETAAILKGDAFDRTVIPHQYAFNVFPHTSPYLTNGYCEEEMKMVNETRKIFHDNEIRITATCVRVPVLRAHSIALNLEVEKKFNVEMIYEILNQSPGIKILEDPINNRWPMPIDAEKQDNVLFGRIRQDISNPNCFEVWIVGDQLLKGAALNAVQIAELL